MSDAPSTVNNAANIVNSIISGSFGAAIKMGETALESEFPILAMPIIKEIVEYVIERELDKYLTVPLKQVATKMVIDIQVNGEASASAQALIEMENAMAKGDPNEIAKAGKALDDAATHLIRWDGSATNAN